MDSWILQVHHEQPRSPVFRTVGARHRLSPITTYIRHQEQLMADKLNEQSATPLPRSVNSPEFRREALHPTENTSQLSNSGPGRRFRCATVIAEYVTPRLRTFHIIGPHSPPGASRPC